MIIYGVIVLIVGLALAAVSVLLILKKAKKIYTYHYDNVKDENRNKFAFLLGVSLLIGSVACIISAILAFSLQDNMAMWVHAIIVFTALVASLCLVLVITKKYNGKILTKVAE